MFRRQPEPPWADEVPLAAGSGKPSTLASEAEPSACSFTE
jgi:hypothetical protein